MIIDDIALTMLPNVGPRTTAHLLHCFGSAENIFAASETQLFQIARLRKDIATTIIKKAYHKAAEKELKFCQKNDIIPIPSTSESYPQLLKECEDYPHVLYYKGNLEALNKQMLSTVGTRKATSYGQRVCERLIGELGEMFPDITIVSGLAFGIDAACHRTALAAGVATIGVLPCVLTEVYPAQHTILAEEMIKKGGGIISEYNSQNKNKGVNFIQRNRIIAGVSMGTVVMESPLRGGSMSTANLADGYNRCVMAVPGRVGDNASEGTNYLIKSNKARMVCSAEDIARELMWDIPDTRKSARNLSTLSKDAAGLLDCIPDGEAISIDMLAELTGLSTPQLSTILIELEFDKFVKVLPGKVYEKI